MLSVVFFHNTLYAQSLNTVISDEENQVKSVLVNSCGRMELNSKDSFISALEGYRECLGRSRLGNDLILLDYSILILQSGSKEHARYINEYLVEALKTPKRGDFLVNTAQIYLHLLKSEQNTLYALELLTEASNSGKDIATEILADYYYGKQQYEKSAVLYQQSGNVGNFESRFMYAQHLHYGLGVNKNEILALNEYIYLDKKKHDRAPHAIFILFSESSNIDHGLSSADAIRFLHKSAERQVAGANFDLGIHYFIDKLVARDMSKALFYLKQADELGDIRAAHSIGILLLTENKLKQSCEWFEKSLVNGYVKSTNKIDSYCK
ncbi:hypothetical protein CW748_15580 [Alteromonadales bacterium alter-6D02]|nr:hypothetical protein CW748_15580 [Alteromonadales bacterium alter-6D02]